MKNDLFENLSQEDRVLVNKFVAEAEMAFWKMSGLGESDIVDSFFDPIQGIDADDYDLQIGFRVDAADRSVSCVLEATDEENGYRFDYLEYELFDIRYTHRPSNGGEWEIVELCDPDEYGLPSIAANKASVAA